MPIRKRLKKYFFRGLAVLLPTIATIMIFVWGFQFIQGKISIHINRALVWLTMLIEGLDYGDAVTRQPFEAFWIHGWGQIAGFVLAVVLVCVVGAVLASVVGRTLWRAVENLITRAPIIRKVYPYIKQLTDFIFTEDTQREQMFLKVVVVEFPRKGVWALGMVTGSGLRQVSEKFATEFLTVLVPTTPSPVTGFTVIIPKEETIELDMTVEEAFRFIFTGGVIIPENQKAASASPSGNPVE